MVLPRFILILWIQALLMVAVGVSVGVSSARQQGPAASEARQTQGGAQQGGVAQPADYRPVAATPVVVHTIKEGVAYWTEGGVGANTGFVIAPTGVVAFDPKETAEAAEEVLADVAKITPKPVTHLIISHSNPDHSKGLPGYPKGVITIAQEAAAKDIEMATWFMRDQNYPRSSMLPTYVVDRKADLMLDGMRVVLYHWAPAHTSGDLVAYFPDLKLVFVGDVMPGLGSHIENEGGTAGMIESLKGIVALDADTFVTGHTPPLTKADMNKALSDAIEKRAKIVALYKAGTPLAEAEKTMGERVVPRLPDDGPPGLKRFRSFRNMNYTEEVYYELSHGGS
jgi:glyoxylase-like metal-dependent hydrolase (beta-lactamase superfamily II)